MQAGRHVVEVDDGSLPDVQTNRVEEEEVQEGLHFFLFVRFLGGRLLEEYVARLEVHLDHLVRVRGPLVLVVVRERGVAL